MNFQASCCQLFIAMVQTAETVSMQISVHKYWDDIRTIAGDTVSLIILQSLLSNTVHVNSQNFQNS